MSKVRVGTCAALLAMVWCTTAFAIPPFEDAWIARYPTSTLPARMQTMAGSSCFLCHHPELGEPGKCYRDDLSVLIGTGMDIVDAIDALHLVDSDGDGFPNGQEATTVRADLPGEVGYHMGLIGDTGTDPCATYPNEAVTGVPETPPGAVPAVSEWGMVAMGILAAFAGAFVLSKRHREAAAVEAFQQRS